MKFNYRGLTYVLERQTSCFVLSIQHTSKEKKEYYSETIGYYTSLTNVLIELFNRHVLDESENKDLLECVRSTKKELKQLLGE